MTRREFFEASADPEVLAANAVSGDSSLRWAAAIELGEIPEKWSVELLWRLKEDADQYVRAVAQKALGAFDPLLIESSVFDLATPVADAGLSEAKVDGSGALADHAAWKTRPLDPPSEENEWAVSAAIINIVNTEGPLTGARLMRLYGESVFPNSPRKLSKFRMKRAVERLAARGIVSEATGIGGDQLEQWILYRSGTPDTLVRTRGSRKLPEIPVTEVAELILQNSRVRSAPLSRDRQFQVIIELYNIEHNELHVAGAALDSEWRSLFDLSGSG